MLLDQADSLEAVTRRASVAGVQRCRMTYLHRLCKDARRRGLRDMHSITLRSLILLLMTTTYLDSLNPATNARCPDAPGGQHQRSKSDASTNIAMQNPNKRAVSLKPRNIYHLLLSTTCSPSDIPCWYTAHKKTGVNTGLDPSNVLKLLSVIDRLSQGLSGFYPPLTCCCSCSRFAFMYRSI